MLSSSSLACAKRKGPLFSLRAHVDSFTGLFQCTSRPQEALQMVNM